MPSGPKIAGNFRYYFGILIPNLKNEFLAFAIAAFASSALLVRASFLWFSAGRKRQELAEVVVSSVYRIDPTEPEAEGAADASQHVNR